MLAHFTTIFKADRGLAALDALVSPRTPIACLCALTIAVGGCASSRAPSVDSNLAAVSELAAASTRALLHGGEKGLEVHQWLIADDPDLIAAAIGRYGELNVLPEGDRDRLRRNGLRLARVPVDALAELEADLGGSFLHNVGWHGQVLQWQELIARPLPQQRALALDGRVRVFDGGRLRLMTRAWLVQMEDGIRLNVQIVPQHFRPAPMSYYRLLGRDTGDGVPVSSMAIDLLLEEGYAYLLTCESPLVDWHQPAGETETDEKPLVRPAAGPDAPTATTVGQMLLRTESIAARPARAVLILVPRIDSATESNLGGLARTLRSAEGARMK